MIRPIEMRRFCNSHFLRPLVFLSLLITVTSLAADERILSYHSDVTILEEGQLDVTETIHVRAEGSNIRRGIYRDFPTRYQDGAGNQYRVGFEVISVSRNDRPEDWHTDSMSNGVRIYAGSANRFLDPGEHIYRFRYQTTRQLGFFEEYDELWWNVTGNGWMFNIDQASATIRLPESVSSDDLILNAYTGVYGSRASHANYRIIDSKTVTFETTRALSPWENLSVIVAFPKGMVAEPTTGQRVRWFLSDNGAALVLTIGWLMMFTWYLWSWNKAGRDPATGIIIPRFEPPRGLSPAACRYVLSMGFRRACFVAAIISLAIKKQLVIDDDDGDFTLTRLADEEGAEPPTRPERAVLRSLFPSGRGSLEMEQSNHSRFRSAKSVLQSNLATEFKGRLFRLNLGYLLPAFIIFFGTMILARFFHGGGLLWVIYLFFGVVTHILFIFLLRAPTPSGRRIMDEIEGFKRYLDTAEEDRLEQMESPRLTPEIFEDFLPYAYALGVENSWCERFENEMPEEVRNQDGGRPNWYRGSSRNFRSINDMGNRFSSSFSSAISSASSPPGSSSGSGGGGSSGGGGGGGGGGGW